jgi:group I intron endonuclease
LAVLYRHTRLDKNEPFYIGIGDNETRAYNKVNRTKHWKSVAKKGYEVEVLLEDLTWEQACEKEKEFIALYGRKDLGTGTLVNLTDGGEGTFGYKHTEEVKQKLRDLYSGIGNQWYGKARPEHSEKLKGEKNPCYGRTGEKNPMFGKEGYWKGKERLDLRNKVVYNGVEFESQTALAKHLNCTLGNITRLMKKILQNN